MAPRDGTASLGGRLWPPFVCGFPQPPTPSALRLAPAPGPTARRPSTCGPRSETSGRNFVSQRTVYRRPGADRGRGRKPRVESALGSVRGAVVVGLVLFRSAHDPSHGRRGTNTSGAARSPSSRSTAPPGRRCSTPGPDSRRGTPPSATWRARDALGRRGPAGDGSGGLPKDGSGSPASGSRSPRLRRSRVTAPAAGSRWRSGVTRGAGEGATLGCFERRFGVPLVDGGTQRLPRTVGLAGRST